MGDLAASGGSYISSPADLIFAEPSTMTGSIGIFAVKVNAERLLATLGVNVETNRRGAHADYLSPYRPWTEAEMNMVLEKMRYLYGQFIETVANGRSSRGLTVAKVDDLGRGQVWTGALAQSVGLVDKLGGLAAAIDEAVSMSGVPVGRDKLPEVLVLPRPPLGLVRRLLGADDPAHARETVLPAQLLTPELRAALRMLAPALLRAGNGFEARLPYDIEIR
jgi:protease-4